MGTINVEQAIFATNEGQRDFEALSKKLEPKQTELKNQNDEVESLKKQLNTQGDKLNDDSRATLVKQIEQKQKSLERSVQDARDDAQNQQNEIAQRILQKMAPMLVKYAADNGFGVIIDTSNPWPNGPVLWAGPAVDITRPVVELYNAQSGVPAPAPKPAATRPAAPTAKPATTSPAAPKPRHYAKIAASVALRNSFCDTQCREEVPAGRVQNAAFFLCRISLRIASEDELSGVLTHSHAHIEEDTMFADFLPDSDWSEPFSPGMDNPDLVCPAGSRRRLPASAALALHRRTAETGVACAATRASSTAGGRRPSSHATTRPSAAQSNLMGSRLVSSSRRFHMT